MPRLDHKYPILEYFAYEHLPPHLQEASKPFHDLAFQLAREQENSEFPSRGFPETEAALRKLLEAKDCAVRARLSRTPKT